MNEGTIVAVNGWEGDCALVEDLMWMHEQHECPVVVFSPNDSRITSMRGHLCRWAGEREWAGRKSMLRQIDYYKILLEYPWEHCMFFDSDSVCLSPEFPRYLYEEDVLWSSEISDEMHARPEHYKFPRIAFHPPWFFSRGLLTRLLNTFDTLIPFNHQTPVIDWMLMVQCEIFGIPHKGFPLSFSLPTDNPGWPRDKAMKLVREGAEFLHTVKHFHDLATFVAIRAEREGQHPL